MDFEPERYVEFFSFRYYDAARKKTLTTRWKMSLEQACAHFGSSQHEVVADSRELRRVGGDPAVISTSAFMRNPP